MKLIELSIRETPPLRIVEISDLTEVVVVAGPNGVGKTNAIVALLNHFRNPAPDPNVRIKLAATTSDEQRLWGGLCDA